MSFWNFLPVVGDILKGGLEFLNKKQDVSLEKYRIDGKVDEAKIAAEGLRLQVVGQNHTENDKYLGGRAMRYIFVYPLGVWWVAVIVDSICQRVFDWKWDVLSAPVISDWGGIIIMYLFVHSTLLGKK